MYLRHYVLAGGMAVYCMVMVIMLICYVQLEWVHVKSVHMPNCQADCFLLHPSEKLLNSHSKVIWIPTPIILLCTIWHIHASSDFRPCRNDGLNCQRQLKLPEQCRMVGRLASSCMNLSTYQRVVLESCDIGQNNVRSSVNFLCILPKWPPIAVLAWSLCPDIRGKGSWLAYCLFHATSATHKVGCFTIYTTGARCQTHSHVD